MMRKKFLLQNNDLNKNKAEGIENHSAKVTVQYIRGQQLVHKLPQNNHPHMMHDDANAQDELEIENVEYLDDNTNVEYIEEPTDKDELEDNFYPNAIHCLLDLYKTKYESLNTDEESSVKVAQIWHDIAKDMQESFFEFNEKQIQHKYILLREQYFAIKTKEEIENFDYFEQLHDIYKDPEKENIVKGIQGIQVKRQYYKDEILLQPEELEVNEHLHDFKSEEIVHKEHEFIDMVEKELQAMEDGTHIEDNKEIATTVATVEVNKKDSKVNIDFKDVCVVNKEEKMDTVVNLEQCQKLKRTRVDTESEKEPPPRKQKTNNGHIEAPLVASAAISANDFSLYHYNEQQERRHREKMSLLEKSLQIQERALQQQHMLLQELIKRLPS